jgi:hypothetical protein
MGGKKTKKTRNNNNNGRNTNNGTAKKVEKKEAPKQEMTLAELVGLKQDFMQSPEKKVDVDLKILRESFFDVIDSLNLVKDLYFVVLPSSLANVPPSRRDNAILYEARRTLIQKMFPRPRESMLEKYKELSNAIQNNTLQTPPELFNAAYEIADTFVKALDKQINVFEAEYREYLEADIEFELNSKLGELTAPEIRDVVRQALRTTHPLLSSIDHIKNELENSKKELIFAQGFVKYQIEFGKGQNNANNENWDKALKQITKAFNFAEEYKIALGTTPTLNAAAKLHINRYEKADISEVSIDVLREHKQLPDKALECYRTAFKYLAPNDYQDINAISHYILTGTSLITDQLEYLANLHIKITDRHPEKDYPRNLAVRELIATILDNFITILKENTTSNKGLVDGKLKELQKHQSTNDMYTKVARLMIERQEEVEKAAQEQKQKEADALSKKKETSLSENLDDIALVKEEAARKAAAEQARIAAKEKRDAAIAQRMAANGGAAVKNNTNDETQEEELPAEIEILSEQEALFREGRELFEKKLHFLANVKFGESLKKAQENNDLTGEVAAYWGSAESYTAEGRKNYNEHNYGHAAFLFGKALHHITYGIAASYNIKSPTDECIQRLETLHAMLENTKETLNTTRETITKQKRDQELLQANLKENREDAIFQKGRKALDNRELFERSKNKENLSEDEIKTINALGKWEWENNPAPKNVESNQRAELESSIEAAGNLSEKLSYVKEGFNYVSIAIKESRPIASGELQKYTRIPSANPESLLKFPNLQAPAIAKEPEISPPTANNTNAEAIAPRDEGKWVIHIGSKDAEDYKRLPREKINASGLLIEHDAPFCQYLKRRGTSAALATSNSKEL